MNGAQFSMVHSDSLRLMNGPPAGGVSNQRRRLHRARSGRCGPRQGNDRNCWSDKIVPRTTLSLFQRQGKPDAEDDARHDECSGRPTDRQDSYCCLTSTCGGASGLRLVGEGLWSPVPYRCVCIWVPQVRIFGPGSSPPCSRLHPVHSDSISTVPSIPVA